MAEALTNTPAPPEIPEMPEFQWAKVAVGYNPELKLDMNEYGSWEAVRALYFGQLRSGSAFSRIEISPWPEEKDDDHSF